MDRGVIFMLVKQQRTQKKEAYDPLGYAAGIS
jgi:hypothetical protein